MPEKREDQTIDYVELAGHIIAAYVSNNPIRTTDLPDLIRTVHAALATPDQPVRKAVLSGRMVPRGSTGAWGGGA